MPTELLKPVETMLRKFKIPLVPRLIRRRRRGKTFGDDQSGVTAVEFALIAPPFFALLLALFEVGLVFFSGSVLENAVNDAARLIRTGQAQQGNFSKSAFASAVCSKLAMFDCGKLVVDVETFQNFSSVGISEPLDADGNLKTNFPFNMGVGGDVVLVRVFYEWKLIAPKLSLMTNMGTGNRLLSTAQVFRNEPF
ncbi:MAG: pilus assembly protein [Hyphomicrobiales bacterium]|nr:MAG: pilus assembly protein [Hyphomicrobiales bacterium]